MSMTLSSVSRGCWRDIIEENSPFPFPPCCVLTKYYSHMLCQWCGGIKTFGGAVPSSVPCILFSVLTTLLLPFQYRDCMFQASHLQLLSDSPVWLPISLSYLCPRGFSLACPVDSEPVLSLTTQWTSWLYSGLQPLLLWGPTSIWVEGPLF